VGWQVHAPGAGKGAEGWITLMVPQAVLALDQRDLERAIATSRRTRC